MILLDEFVLPLSSPARCDAMLERDLLNRLTDPPAEVIAWDTTSDPVAECARIEREVATGGLQLAILGLGTNGHVGTNEPGSSADSRSRLVELHDQTARGAIAYGADILPTQGFTLGIGTLLEADEIWLLVTGAHKRNMLHRVLSDPVTNRVPASLLREHPNFTVFADDDAVEPKP